VPDAEELSDQPRPLLLLRLKGRGVLAMRLLAARTYYVVPRITNERPNKGCSMLRLTRTIAIAAAMLTLYSPAQAQKLAKGGLSGIVISKSMAVPDGGSATVYITPSAGDGFFVLTQFVANGCVTLSGNTFGQIIPSGQVPSGGSGTYVPGIALPPGEILTATDTVNQFCQGGVIVLINGVVSNK
jgi:hypothetical protein